MSNQPMTGPRRAADPLPGVAVAVEPPWRCSRCGRDDGTHDARCWAALERLLAAAAVTR